MASSDKGTPSRLATLRPTRDLSLGGKVPNLTRGGAVKRKYAPVIPTATNKKNETAPVENNNNNDDHETTPNIPNKRQRRSETRNQYDKSHQKHKGRYNPNLIQTNSSLEATLKEWALNSKKEKFIATTFSGGSIGRNKKNNGEVLDVLEDADMFEESTLKDEFFALSIPNNEESIPTMNPLALPPKQKNLDSVPKAPNDSHLSADKKGFHTESFYRVILPSILPSTTPRNTKQDNQASSEDAPQDFNTLSKFPEGLFGKIRFTRSGKVTMVLGGNELTLKGTSSRYYQEGKMLDTRINPPEHIDLGQIHHCLDFRPDLMSLVLKEYKALTLDKQGGGAMM